MNRAKKEKYKPYRALFTADIHMSNNLPYAKHETNGVTDRLLDQQIVINGIFDKAKKTGCQSIFMLGDIFDRSRVDAITLTTTVQTLSQSPVDLYIVPGNHDGVNTRGERFTVEALSEIPNIHYMKTGIPFRPVPWLLFWPLEFATLDKTQQELSRIRTNKNNTNVLLMHNAIVGCTHAGWECKDGFGIDRKKLFSKFDYVLSGHFHHTQKIGKKGRYVGSPFPLHYGEMGLTGVYWIYDFGDKSFKEYCFPSFAPRFFLFDYDEFSLKTVLKDKSKNSIGKYDYIRINVSCTHAEFIAKKHNIERIIEKLKKKGMKRVSYVHEPVYHHAKRISKDNKGSVSIDSMIDEYVDVIEKDINNINPEELKVTGREIFESVVKDA